MNPLRSAAAWPVLALLALGSGCAKPPAAAPPDPSAVASAYLEAGRVNEAAREIELAVRASPNSAMLHKQAAEIQVQAGHNGKAIRHLESAQQLNPSDPEIWIRLGELEMLRENTADAYVAFRHAAELAPDEIRAVSGLALAAEQLGFEEEAEAAYARWAEIEKARAGQ
jgi:Flp pilus assembly protein TadD